jgi:hypothetical protein
MTEHPFDRPPTDEPVMPPTDEPVMSGPPPAQPPPGEPTRRANVPQAAASVVGGLLLLVVGVLWLLDATDTIELRWRILLPISLIIVGITCAAVSTRQRVGGLVTVGVVLSVLVVASALLPDQLGFRVGDQIARPAAVSDIRDEYSHGIGQLTIDLRDLELDTDITVAAGVGMGELLVRVPDEITIVVVASAGIGEVSALGRSSSGFGARLDERFPIADGGPVIRLELSVGIGEVVVRR